MSLVNKGQKIFFFLLAICWTIITYFIVFNAYNKEPKELIDSKTFITIKPDNQIILLDTNPPILENNLIKYYNLGFNDAMDAMALLDLELKMKNENKNWGERMDILRTRFNLPQKTNSNLTK